MRPADRAIHAVERRSVHCAPASRLIRRGVRRDVCVTRTSNPGLLAVVLPSAPCIRGDYFKAMARRRAGAMQIPSVDALLGRGVYYGADLAYRAFMQARSFGVPDDRNLPRDRADCSIEPWHPFRSAHR